MLDLKILATTDLHCVGNLYVELGAAVDKHRPDVVALVGDFLDALGSEHKQLTTANCAKALAALPCKNIIFTRGNHEYDNWSEFEGTWSKTGGKCTHCMTKPSWTAR
jgi:predicted MPP superfamily phosphohydrolase